MSRESAEDLLFARFERGDRLACARLISLAEAGDPLFARLYDRLARRTGAAHRIGLTGPPGTGKSTLADVLIRQWRETGTGKVGVVAVDPTSPFTGGALLGDRIRMHSRAGDPEVFIRSMASREGRSGLARASTEACDVLDAWGARWVLLETVGVGQVGVDVRSLCETTVVVLHPGAGDSIQAMKAGLLEIAHLFVVNKADQPGAERMIADLEEMLELRSEAVRAELGGAWNPRVLSVSAREQRGISELAAALEEHRSFLEGAGLRVRAQRHRRRDQVRRLVDEGLRDLVWTRRGYGAALERELDLGTTGPYALAERWIGEIGAAFACAGGGAEE